MVGRPWLWGAACGGADGVEDVLRLLYEETDRSLALVGRPSVAELDRSAVQLGSEAI